METCRQRDVKGLYHQEEKGNIQQFTGVSAPFERPIDADMIISTEEKSVEECLDVLEKQFKLSKA
jgi:adenylylsulfate kinase-like enzyme